jgi:hypothetical protein
MVMSFSIYTFRNECVFFPNLEKKEQMKLGVLSLNIYANTGFECHYEPNCPLSIKSSKANRNNHPPSMNGILLGSNTVPKGTR